MNTDQLGSAVLIMFLAVLAYEDIRKETMNLVVITVCGASGAALKLISGAGVMDILPGTAVGLLLLALSFASRQAIGYGDGLVFTASGIYLGLTGNIVFLLVSLILGAIASALLIAIKVKRKNDRIPFAPFMLAGYVLMAGIY